LTSLRVSHLEVRYGDLIGVADVSLQVARGSVVALLGSNGSGKTTTLNAIAGLVRPSGGSIEWDGSSIARQPAYAIVGSGLALSPEGWRLFVAQTVEQNLRLGATPLADRSRLGALFERAYALFPRLAERRHQLAGTLSGGEQQMLAIGRGIASAPRLLMLDEPSMGLAPAVADAIFERIAALHREDGLTILLVEQRVAEAVQSSDFGYVLDGGRVVLSGTSADLLADDRIRTVYLGL
jgi:branched-chain amino acid transport system ATP-binding protein